MKDNERCLGGKKRIQCQFYAINLARFYGEWKGTKVMDYVNNMTWT